MAIRHTTVKCPHCGKVAYQATGSTNYAGCPIRECKYCRKTYFDSNYHEYALKPRDWWVKHAPVKWLDRSISICMTIVLLALFSIDIWGSPGWVEYWMHPTLFLSLAFVVVGRIVYGILHTNIAIDDDFEREYIESTARLNDPEYRAFIEQMDRKR